MLKQLKLPTKISRKRFEISAGTKGKLIIMIAGMGNRKKLHHQIAMDTTFTASFKKSLNLLLFTYNIVNYIYIQYLIDGNCSSS